jgi:hypothetical protein
MKTNKNFLQIIYYIPRALGIIFIVFMSLFSLDVFGETGPWYMILAGFLMHLIPVMLLLVILLYAWRREFVGGIIFIGLAIIFTIFFNTYRQWQTFIMISFPVFLTGFLFILHERLEKKH